jgi:hypothetical protein
VLHVETFILKEASRKRSDEGAVEGGESREFDADGLGHGGGRLLV